MNYKVFTDKTFNCKCMGEAKECYYSKKLTIEFRVMWLIPAVANLTISANTKMAMTQ